MCDKKVVEMAEEYYPLVAHWVQGMRGHYYDPNNLLKQYSVNIGARGTLGFRYSKVPGAPNFSFDPTLPEHTTTFDLL